MVDFPHLRVTVSMARGIERDDRSRSIIQFGVSYFQTNPATDDSRSLPLDGCLGSILEVEMYDVRRCHSWTLITCLSMCQPCQYLSIANGHLGQRKPAAGGHSFPSEMIFRVGKPRMPKRLPRKADWQRHRHTDPNIPGKEVKIRLNMSK